AALRTWFCAGVSRTGRLVSGEAGRVFLGSGFAGAGFWGEGAGVGAGGGRDSGGFSAGGSGVLGASGRSRGFSTETSSNTAVTGGGSGCRNVHAVTPPIRATCRTAERIHALRPESTGDGGDDMRFQGLL